MNVCVCILIFVDFSCISICIYTCIFFSSPFHPRRRLVVGSRVATVRFVTMCAQQRNLHVTAPGRAASHQTQKLQLLSRVLGTHVEAFTVVGIMLAHHSPRERRLMTALQCQLVALHHAQQMIMAIMLLCATARRLCSVERCSMHRYRLSFECGHVSK